MYSPTYGELKSYLQKELDIEDETFITADELLSYFNEGVDIPEAAIHNIYEDYFLTNTTIYLVNGTQSYALPSDIYPQKIRRILYNYNGSKKYVIKQMKKLEDQMFVDSNDYYRYIIKNSGTSGLQLCFFPTPYETSSNTTMWYIRNAKRFTADADVCDIPEFTSVIVQYARWKCLNKEGHPDTQQAAMDLDRMKQEKIGRASCRERV